MRTWPGPGSGNCFSTSWNAPPAAGTCMARPVTEDIALISPAGWIGSRLRKFQKNGECFVRGARVRRGYFGSVARRTKFFERRALTKSYFRYIVRYILIDRRETHVWTFSRNEQRRKRGAPPGRLPSSAWTRLVGRPSAGTLGGLCRRQPRADV